ncbi:cell division protein [Phenylobacterium sp.]|uniref:cell division protein FtsL n=1 Tax=Phenylobacterium sp. TaxID=1871053 RepID=UPI002731201D|nr:cell division protein [Phenylobacterium sp.]MDP1873253.1 cell division protein [Phenylobacterium sp.]MDP3491444.1 cell division protein [Phenylobacterium sp.]
MSVLNRRIRGFRLVDVIALGLLVLLIMSVYLAKTIASRERAEIASVERQIAAERAQIRLLEAEVAHLEQPSRIERLSTLYLEMGPVDVTRETTADSLAALAPPKAPSARAPAPKLEVVP